MSDKESFNGQCPTCGQLSHYSLTDDVAEILAKAYKHDKWKELPLSVLIGEFLIYFKDNTDRFNSIEFIDRVDELCSKRVLEDE